jgi:ABC-type nitrate/sulfonate/bicarbonate transport system permease component
LVIYRSRWHLAATIGLILLPFIFFLIFSQIVHFTAGRLLEDVLVSLWRMLIGYLIALVLAWVAALAFYRGKRALVALPVFDVLQSFPTFAALPLAVYYLGHSNTTIIFFLVLAIIWPLFFAITSSLKLIKHDWEEAVHIAGLRGWKRLWYYLIPVTVPGVVTGSIIGLGDGWEALVATEIIAIAPTGLGSFYQTFSQNATITTFGILGFLLIIFSINKLIWLPLLDWSHRTMEE